MNDTYPLAAQGIYRSLQGEGILFGLPTVFIRLAGCSVGCPECDTDYTVDSRVTASKIASKVSSMLYHQREWVWVTGGEPAVYDLKPLVNQLRNIASFPRLALATSGIKPVQAGMCWHGFDMISVSPHSQDNWVVRRGEQINLVPTLNGLTLAECTRIAASAESFTHRFLTPPQGASPELVADCMEWVHRHPGWRLGLQCHKFWGLP